MNKMRCFYFLFFLLLHAAAVEWQDSEALYRLRVDHDVTGEYGYLDFKKICLPATLENGVRVFTGDGKTVSIHQYDNDHFLLPAADRKISYYIYYGYAKKQRFQRWNSRLTPVPDNFRLRQQDVSRRYPNSPEEAGNIESLKQNSPIIRNRREFWKRIGEFATAQMAFLGDLHTALVQNRQADPKICRKYKEAIRRLCDKVHSVRIVATDTLESVFFSHFQNRRRGSDVSRIFFTQRPFDTDRNFVACFSGNLAVEEAGEYEFRLNTNSTRILRINGKTLLRRFGEFQNPNSYAIGSSDILTVPLSRGSHFLEFLYYKGPIANWAALSWRKKGEGAFRLLTEDDFAPAIPLFPARSEAKSGKRYPIVLRDDSLALFTAKHHSYSLDRYQVLNPDYRWHWELDSRTYPSEVSVFALRHPDMPILKLIPESPDYLPLEVIRKERTGIKVPLRPDLSLRLWAPYFLYDDEYASITLEINSGLPTAYTALFSVSTGMNPVFASKEEYIPVSAIPMEHEDRYAKNQIIKRSYPLDARMIEQEITAEFRLILPGLLADSRSLRILPVSSLPDDLQTSPEGLLDGEGRRLLPILHRSSLHEIRAWELPRKLGAEWRRHQKILVIAEDSSALKEKLTSGFARHGMELEFLPWSRSSLPSGSAVMETLPEACRRIAASDADGALVIPPSSARQGILGFREEMNMISLLLERLSLSGKIRTIVLSTPLPLSPRRYGMLEEKEQKLHKSLRELRRERGISFLELNAILRQDPAWTEENYRKNGEEIALPDSLAAAAASLIEAEFERK